MIVEGYSKTYNSFTFLSSFFVCFCNVLVLSPHFGFFFGTKPTEISAEKEKKKKETSSSPADIIVAQVAEWESSDWKVKFALFVKKCPRAT